MLDGDNIMREYEKLSECTDCALTDCGSIKTEAKKIKHNKVATIVNSDFFICSPSTSQSANCDLVLFKEQYVPIVEQTQGGLNCSLCRNS